MAKQKKQDRDETAAAGPTPWGYGFERAGAKWRAYRTDGSGVTYLTPEPGRELHSVVAKLNEKLAEEISKALRNRGKA